MRRKILCVGWVCGLGALLAACTTPPSRYYSLADTSAGAVETNSRPPSRIAPYGLLVQVLGIPAQADRSQLLVRDPARGPAVDVLSQSLWAAPLIDQVQAVLADRISADLGAPDVQRLPGLAGRPVRQMQVRVTRFDLVWGQGADLAATWTDRGPEAKDPSICQAQIRAPAAQGVAALVDAQRRALRILGDLMARRGASDPGSPDADVDVQAGCT